MNEITMKLNADELILRALKEDISSEDVTTNSVMREFCLGEVELICKQDGVLAGLWVFERVFKLLNPETECIFVKAARTNRDIDDKSPGSPKAPIP